MYSSKPRGGHDLTEEFGIETRRRRTGSKENPHQLLADSVKRAAGHDHLGAENPDAAGHSGGNSRNGSSRRKLIGDFGDLDIETPLDLNGTFEPKIVGNHQTHWTGFDDDRILSMYARGMTTREIHGQLRDIYGVGASPALISGVTGEVEDEVRVWQNRPLHPIYPIIYPT